MPDKKAAEKKSHWKPLPLWARILIIIAACILVFALVAFITVNVVLNKISRPELNQSYITESQLEAYDLQEAIAESGGEDNVVYPELDPAQIQWTTPDGTLGEDQALINILLIGEDARPGESRARSDSMILVTFNRKSGSITMTSFLRDLYVQIPGYQDNRLNAAFAFGGMELLDETLLQNFGVQVDANVSVNFEGFSQVIDILEGVDIELTQGEAEVLGLTPGINHLDGEVALNYARIRKLDNDFGRTARQRNVLSALIDSLRDASIVQLNTLMDEILPLITTDMTNMQILSYAAELLPMLSGASISSCTIPAEGTYSYNTIRSMAVIVADFEANRDILKETLTPNN